MPNPERKEGAVEPIETDDLRLAHHVADVAEALSLREFSRGPVAARRKPDGTPVSAADREIEEAILGILARDRPRDAVLGEESGRHGTGARRWIVDPIDGTESFLARGRFWATSIALTLDGEPCLGVVSSP
jgi:histidinol-phosphatase